MFRFPEPKYRASKFLKLSLLVTVIGFFTTNSFSQNFDKRGVIDLSDHDFHGSPMIALDGEWEFYWNELLNNDDLNTRENRNYRDFLELWNTDLEAFGYATYSIIIKLPDRTPTLSLQIPDFYSSYELFSANQIIAKNGKVATNKEKYIPKWIPKTVSIKPDSSNTIHLILHVANFHHQRGGAYQPITIGDSEFLSKKREQQLAYAYILTGTLLMGGFFFLGLYLFGQHEKAILYFSVFSLIYSYRIIGFGIYPLHFLLPEIPWIVTLKLEYITLFLSGYFFGLYTFHLYPKESSRLLFKLLNIISLTFFGIALLFPASIFTHLVTPYFLILISYIVYAFWIYIKATIEHRDGAKFALASTGVIFLVFLYQMMAYFGIFSESLLINSVGYFSFFFFQSLVLSYRFSISLKRSSLKAEEASRAKSQFLSTMSHEIRTPLNAIIGLSELLRETKLDSKQKDFASTIKLSGENLLGIINNILDYSKIESGKIELDISEFEVQEIVENALDLIAPLNTNPKVDLIYHIDDSVSPYIKSDSIKLQQVLINLINNAVKFTEEGEVFVSISMEDLTTNKAKLQVSIKDTGIGIPEESVQKLFQSFTQVDSSTTRKYGGTGLGLVISKTLIESLGGSITVDTTSASGTTFKFEILVEKSSTQRKQYSSSLLKGKKALVIDDNETNLKIIAHQCRKQEIKTFTTTDPYYVSKNPHTLKEYDFVILDMQMPEKSGHDIAEDIRSKYKNDQLPIVIMSSIHIIGDKIDRDLFNLHLTKPVKQSLLFRNLEKLFSTDLNDHNGSEEDIQNNNDLVEASILVAEDNLFNQKVIQQMLERMGCTVELVENGEQAFQKATTEYFDLIFMDMEMPVMDGLESTRKIIDHFGVKKVAPPIVAMTANVMAQDKDRCIAAGMVDFVPKPITFLTVKTTIIKWLAPN